MKKTITLTLICLSLFVNAQTNKVSYVSKDKDTLILPNTDIGKLIASTWEKPPVKEKKPVILFADEQYIYAKNQKMIRRRNSLKDLK